MMSEPAEPKEKCICGVVPDVDWEECGRCDGTGNDESNMFWPGCARCDGKGVVPVYHCDCDPCGDDE